MYTDSEGFLWVPIGFEVGLTGRKVLAIRCHWAHPRENLCRAFLASELADKARHRSHLE